MMRPRSASVNAALSLVLLLVATVTSGASPSPTRRVQHAQAAASAAGTAVTTTTAMVPTAFTTTSAARSRTYVLSSRHAGGWQGGRWSRSPSVGRSSSSSSSSLCHHRSNRLPATAGGVRSLRCLCAVPPPGVSPMAWDAGVSVVVGTASVVWVKLWTGLARREKMKPQVSRKVVHTTAAPMFMVLWPFFTDRPCARLFAAAVPMVQAARLAAAGLSGDPDNDDASTNELVKAISRSGRASETLNGPLKYSLAIVLITILEWRTSVVGVIAMLQMAVGDGMADLVGRHFGKHKWSKGGEKSVEGSAAFASGSFLASMVMIQWFHRFGLLSISPAAAAGNTALISVACAAVELLPPRLVGDDNLSVPITALIVGRLLF